MSIYWTVQLENREACCDLPGRRAKPPRRNHRARPYARIECFAVAGPETVASTCRRPADHQQRQIGGCRQGDRRRPVREVSALKGRGRYRRSARTYRIAPAAATICASAFGTGVAVGRSHQQGQHRPIIVQIGDAMRISSQKRPIFGEEQTASPFAAYVCFSGGRSPWYGGNCAFREHSRGTNRHCHSNRVDSYGTRPTHYTLMNRLPIVRPCSCRTIVAGLFDCITPRARSHHLEVAVLFAREAFHTPQH